MSALVFPKLVVLGNLSIKKMADEWGISIMSDQW